MTIFLHCRSRPTHLYVYLLSAVFDFCLFTPVFPLLLFLSASFPSLLSSFLLLSFSILFLSLLFTVYQWSTSILLPFLHHTTLTLPSPYHSYHAFTSLPLPLSPPYFHHTSTTTTPTFPSPFYPYHYHYHCRIGGSSTAQHGGHEFRRSWEGHSALRQKGE